MSVSSEVRAAWTQHWKSGHAGSLPNARGAPALASIESAWELFFSELPTEARLLDLATGGGDVLRRALAKAKNFRITGVDIADLSAVREAFQAPGIALVGDTDLSKLPFADATFDAVTSQFGIEYADIPAATREAARVMAPGGRGLFVHHHSDSAITRSVVNSLAAYREVFKEKSAFEWGRALFALRQRGASESEIQEAEIEFRSAAVMLQSRLRDEPRFNPVRRVVDVFSQLARAPGSAAPRDALDMLDQAEEHLRTSNLRNQAQIEAALGESGIQNVQTLLTDAGAVVSTPVLLKTPQGHALAWSLEFRK